MTSVRQFVDFFWDSPTYGRDRANLISGLTIGISTLLLNGAVLMLMTPLLFAADEVGFQRLTDHIGIGQLLALTLLGGASAFATVLIPLRLITVFFEPRTGRYFDQIVLTGISPLRFVIGKAVSQNLFLGLILFLLIPYLIFSLTLGGVNLVFFIAALFLVWLYCMSLALATLWASLYLNELIAAIGVIIAATYMCICGCIPTMFQPCILSPFPALLQPVYTSMPELSGTVPQDFLPTFLSCVFGMTAFIAAAMFAIFLGPLYGIIRENSTFGEVVRDGDSKKKRWTKLRVHIQRASEIAFFYQNRSDWFVAHEALIRWGIGFCGLLILSAGGFLVYCYVSSKMMTQGRTDMQWFAPNFHSGILSIHGFGLAIAANLFSHSKNTTYMRIPLWGQTKAEVSKLDTISFLLFLVLSTAASIATPFQFEQLVAIPAGSTVFPQSTEWTLSQGVRIDFRRTIIEGSVVVSLMGLVVYAFQRLACLNSWMRTSTFAVVGTLYGIFIGLLPLLFGLFVYEIMDLRRIQALSEWAPIIAMFSPFAYLTTLTQGQLGQPFPQHVSELPFYIVHGILLFIALLLIRNRGRKLRRVYLTDEKPLPVPC